MHNIHAKFHENQSVGSKVESMYKESMVISQTYLFAYERKAS